MTRGSWVLTFIMVAAAAAYLATMPPPMAWTWAQWMQTVAALAGAIAAKLGNSPLRGA